MTCRTATTARSEPSAVTTGDIQTTVEKAGVKAVLVHSA